MNAVCLFCGGNADEPNHLFHCDGRQGKAEARVRLGAHFDGQTYEPTLDHARLTGQLARVSAAMLDGRWRTLGELEGLTGDQPQSISARLRDLRKEKFGGLVVERRRRGDGPIGLWEYRLIREISQTA